jgi:hypothetical protein
MATCNDASFVLRTLAEGFESLVMLLRGAAAQNERTPDELLALDEAARLARTSVRVLKDAIRADELPAFGGQRDRAVRRRDLEAWIASRRVHVSGPDDRDIDRRMRVLAGGCRNLPRSGNQT